MKYSLSMTDTQHENLKSSLIKDDEKERVTWALCGTASTNEKFTFLINSIHPLQDEEYITSSETRVTWKTESILDLIDKAEKNNLTLVKFHSHPSGSNQFSKTDDISDKEIFKVIDEWSGTEINFASCIMTPDGKLTGRYVNKNSFNFLTHIKVVGYNVLFFEEWGNDISEFATRNIQAFGEDTFRIFKNIRIGVAGCSGTGSQVIEQLIRLGVGELILVDFDDVEIKNLNRITNLSIDDANNKRIKVSALKKNIDQLGLDTKITAIPKKIQTEEAVRELSTCDVIFGCLDTKSGRHTLNRLTSYYIIPYFDIGVRLESDGKGNVDGIHSAIHYLQPGKKNLLLRNVYDMEEIRAENKYHEDPKGYQEEFHRGYIKGVDVDRPAVIPVNAIAAGFAVMDLLARIHDYRSSGNDNIDKIIISISGEILGYEEVTCNQKDIFEKHVGKGDVIPLLDMPAINKDDND